MGKKLTILGLSAGLVGGGAAGLAFTGNAGLAGAQTATTTAPADSGAANSTAQADLADKSSRLAEVLAPLVSDGTLTQAQADKVIATLKAAGPFGGDHSPGGLGRGGAGLDAAAKALGLTTDELRTRLQDGSTITEIAGETGVGLSGVKAAMLAEMKEKLAEAVADGKLTQDQADQRLANAEERINAMVNGEMPQGGHRGLDGGRPPADRPTGSSTTTTAN